MWLHRIRPEFSETEVARTQEFTLQWSAKPNGPLKEIVRQQWSFSPQGSTNEIEDYQVNLNGVSVLERALKRCSQWLSRIPEASLVSCSPSAAHCSADASQYVTSDSLFWFWIETVCLEPAA
jgi:hypothetical protein